MGAIHKGPTVFSFMPKGEVPGGGCVTISVHLCAAGNT